MPVPGRSQEFTNCAECGHRSMNMFCDLAPEELKDFDSIGMLVRLPKGAILFQEDDPGNSVAVICEGQVKLSCTSRDGKTLILKIALAGDVLGLGAVVSGTRYEVTAEAIQPTVVKSVRKEEFLQFLNRHGQASMHAAQTLSEEYKAAFFDARRLALAPSAAGRLSSILLDWGAGASCGKQEMRFTMALTHEELANFAGTSRETVSRVMGKLKREKVIQVNGSSITILAPEKLRALAR